MHLYVFMYVCSSVCVYVSVSFVCLCMRVLLKGQREREGGKGGREGGREREKKSVHVCLISASL